MKLLTENPWATSTAAFVQEHPVLWFVLLALFLLYFFLKWLSGIFPAFDVLRAKVLLPVAKRYKHKKLQKIAIKSDIRGNVNREIAKVKNFLPGGWAEEMDIDWVDNEEPCTLWNDKRMIVRIRPVENQEHNFVNASYFFLRSSFFPKMQSIIPKSHYEASVLYICRKIAEGRSKETAILFEDNFLEPSVQKYQDIPGHLEDYEYLDNRGFFTGTFLRELHATAANSRFVRARNNIPKETEEILTHMKNFVEAYDRRAEGKEDISPSEWSHNGPISKFAVLLVANPEKVYSIDPYVNRARKDFSDGAKRLYVFGANKEQKFANAVISSIEGTIDGAKLVEHFETPFDYRGMEKGMGAVFEFEQPVIR